MRPAFLIVWDIGSWLAAALLAIGGRYDLSLTADQWAVAGAFTLTCVVVHLVLGWILRIYQSRHQLGSLDEALTLAVITALIVVGVGVPFLLGGPQRPVWLLVTVPFAALLAMAAGRLLGRAIRTSQRPRCATDAEPVLIYGAGEVGAQVAKLITFDPESPYRVVGFLDDDVRLKFRRIGGKHVLGTGTHAARIAAQTGAKTVIVAIRDLAPENLRVLAAGLDEAGLTLLKLPPFDAAVDSAEKITLSGLQQVNLADVLGRPQVHTDLAAVQAYLSGRVVLVTGAGGSIGSEICRQVHKFGPKELIMLDRDESGLHGTQLSVYGSGLLDTPDMVLCDIRDIEALEQVFDLHRPDVVFHAAALKHLPMLEQYPDEAWKTNVLGTRNVLQAAVRFGVSRVVNISTDKAAAPTSVLGKSKRQAEELTAHFSPQLSGGAVSVRFGNVLGSRGSMLHTFTQQIERGGPVTVTDPEVTRFFMTIPEACELTLQAGAIGDPGDVLVLDMGEPVRILDIARRLIAQSGQDIAITFTGLRPGEKLNEVLFSGAEDHSPTSHELISRVQVPPRAPAALDRHVLDRRPADGEPAAIGVPSMPLRAAAMPVAAAPRASSPITAEPAQLVVQA
ncbi:polysaccharide biosynthesis protein [Granulicoccus phenolivorans]|uniref:polysaccharide biosynthesis protein n=1 Tax=Granulicoccus phenolivorans TaxID=266854 RepID=UPI0003FF2719|nr:nucleoside-diphosphate sugar epimerase/dehydratase [Granulicoccus phenolivorans]